MVRRAAALFVIAVSVAMSACSGSSAPRSSSPAADRFLDRYVTSDGRVLRHDQGGDIVSEGQAYGMLIAELADRPATARTIWSWTARHLQRSDGLLSYHADGAGHVLDTQSAADADILAAYALLRYHGSDAAPLHAAGRRIADAVLAAESVTMGDAPLITAGPWARTTAPPTVNPSYLMPGVFAALAHYTGDGRWQRAVTASVRLVAQLTGDGRSLPTDWARLTGGRLTAAPDPGGGAPVQYGLDAARLPLWFGTACTSAARQLSGRWWSHVLSQGGSADLALAPSGAPINRDGHPLPLLAAAAAAAAAGDGSASSALRQRASGQARTVPTYYGDAWVALGDALLNGTLDPCKEAGSG